MKCSSGYGEENHKIALQKNHMEIKYDFLKKLYQNPPNLTQIIEKVFSRQVSVQKL